MRKLYTTKLIQGQESTPPIALKVSSYEKLRSFPSRKAAFHSYFIIAG